MSIKKGVQIQSKMPNRNRKVECDVCNKLMRSDTLKRHKKIHKDLLSHPDNGIKDELKSRQEFKKKQEEKIQKVVKIARENNSATMTASSQFNNAESLLKSGRTSKNKTCSKCLENFNKIRDLQRHTRNRKDLLCQHCDRTFCNEYHLGKHLRSISQTKIITKNYQCPIHSKTGYENDPKFQELLDEKRKYIDNFEKKFTNHWIINQRTDPGYTYQDLDLLLTNIYSKQANSFKINIGFGFVLFNTQTGEYKYHYISSNNLLFEKAFSITNIQDVERLMKKICDLDLETNAYLSKPTSSWVLAGITNIEVWIFQMKDKPIG